MGAAVARSTSEATPRRRDEIVLAAGELFAGNGFAAVGMDDIGAAAGVTGPAIYRHFPSKAAVLVAVVDRIIDAVTTVDTSPGGPAQQLSAAVRGYAAGVSAFRGQMAVFVREVHHLPDEYREALQARQRRVVHHWRSLTSAVHPDWDAERVRTAVHATFGLLNSVGTFSSPLPDAELAAQLGELALRALAVP